MFTVVITEQEHLDSIREYQSFLKPFLDNTNIAFCRWRQEGTTLTDAVPGLYETVARHERWRLIVVCDEEGLEKKNPFDLVEYADPAQPEDMEQADYLALRRQARLDAYNRAAKKPLVRLMTWLCQPPLVTSGNQNAQDMDPEFAEYLAQAQAKEQIRRQIMGDYVPEVALPAEVICIAKRCCDLQEHMLKNSWAVHMDSQYSRFYDWNLYFDKMRYLIFDILPKNHRNYTFDYIRFLYALMVLAQNETPMAALAPNRVYVLSCQNDEAALSRLLSRFDAKLEATQEYIRAEMRKTQSKQKSRLSDREAESIFCANMTVPVTTVQDFDQSTLYVRDRSFGLSTDCPESEAVAWSHGYQSSRRALSKFLKAPRRSLKKTTSEIRRLNTADLESADRLNEFQLEDVADYVADEEQKMVATQTCDLYHMDRYVKRMEEQNKRVNAVIEGRMTRKWTMILGAVALGLYLTGFLPMFFTNLKTGNGTLFSLLFFAAGAGVMALTAIAALVFLRLPLRAAYSKYNGIMKGVVNDVEGSLVQYSKYLSHACNVMRGNSVLNFCKEANDPNAAAIRVLKKHEMDVQCVREELHEIFGIFIPKREEGETAESYPYDFYRPLDYAYPIPFTADRRTHIEFLQPGNLVEVPVDFIKSMRVRREELYD